MKSKYFLLAAFVVLAFSSCRKTYDCSCTVDGETSVTSFANEHKSNVKNRCDQMEKSARLVDTKATCVVEEALNQQP